MLHPYLTRLRRALALMLSVLLLVSLTGCFKDKEPDSTDGIETPPPSQTQTLPPETNAPETDPPETQEPAPTATEPSETTPVSSTVYGTVTPDKLNIRKEPSVGAAKSGYYVKGDRVEITETKNGWGRTKHGWILLEYIQMDSGNQTEEPTEPKEIISDGSTKALGYGVVTIGSLNVRTGPGTKHEAVTTVSLCQRFPYYQKDANWVRIEKGWISLSYFYVEGTTGEGSGSGTVSGSGVNIRSGPGTDYDKVGAYDKDTKVTILTQVDKWGYTEKGWVNMGYVTMKENPTGKGTVTADSLNIRKEPKIDAEKVGQYAKDTVIEILEVKGDWGRTDKGWVSLDYVTMEQPKTQKGTVTASSLYIRKEPKQDAEAVGSYDKNETVEILETKDGWGRTDKGWISLAYVKLENTNSRTVTNPGQTGTVTSNGLNIRKEPKITSESLGGYQKGEKIRILETKDGWGRTDKGWVYLEYVEMES